jgi:hypothetical protein
MVNRITYVDLGSARTAAGSDDRARIEALLDQASGEVLAELWQRLCPFVVDKLPVRHAMIRDLAEFVEALQPHVGDMQVDDLCRLIEKYAAHCSVHGVV